MRLYEFEAKQLLSQHGIHIPAQFDLVPFPEVSLSEPAVVKGQVLFGNRKQAGVIHLVDDAGAWSTLAPQVEQALRAKQLVPGEIQFLIEERVPYEQELYVSFQYDTRWRQPMVMFTSAGGTGIEDRKDDIGLTTLPLEDLAATPLPKELEILKPVWESLLNAFFQNDMTLLEINPLVVRGDGQLVALDAKIELDDTAAFRHPEWAQLYPPRTLFARQPTKRELRAKEVNALDHRGVAGASYFEFDGTIGILASGGGASLLAMDALLASELTPANYTEYSGNPSPEKVTALTEVVLSQPQLEGLWVIGGHANFTDIHETLMAIMDAVRRAQLPSGFPIVIRRGGPRQEEAFQALAGLSQELDLDIRTYSSDFPITDTVAVLEDAVHAFRQKGRA